jgi:hypothetical protein
MHLPVVLIINAETLFAIVQMDSPKLLDLWVLLLQIEEFAFQPLN